MGDYVAEQPLFIGLVRAHNPGDLIPAEKVERFGWQDRVRKATASEKKSGVAEQDEVEQEEEEAEPTPTKGQGRGRPRKAR